MKLEVFGRELQIARDNDHWTVFDLGNEGKKRLARDIVIPASVPESELLNYLADLLHEHASIRHPEAKLIE